MARSASEARKFRQRFNKIAASRQRVLCPRRGPAHAGSRGFQSAELCENPLHHFHIIRRPDQPFVESVVEEAQSLWIEAQEIQQCGVEVANVYRVFGSAEA